MSGHEPKSPVQPGPGSHLKGEVGERVVESTDNGKWRRKTTKTLGGDAVQSLWVNTLTTQTHTDQLRSLRKLTRMTSLLLPIKRKSKYFQLDSVEWIMNT